ncbi:hypothetical protein B0O99DRAFT_632614, partial [Bisporella sp. PMI_857]
MLRHRTPLAPINGNKRKRGKELTPYNRGKIIGASLASLAPRQIELQIDVSRAAVRGTIALDKSRLNGNSLPRTGRPLIYNDREIRLMLRNLRISPDRTF